MRATSPYCAVAKSWSLNRLWMLAACLAATAAITPQTLDAQRVTGVVRERDANAPIAGAVVSLLDSAGHLVARTITDRLGTFVISSASSTQQVRVIRIGFKPFTRRLRGGDT